jgi:hypothetical protein
MNQLIKDFYSSSELANKASFLVEQGQFSRAAEQWLQAFQLSPTVLKYLDQAIYFYGLAGHFHRATELLNTWKIYSPQQPHRLAELAPQMIRFMEAKQVGEVQLEGLINLAISILLQNRLPVLPEQFNLSLVTDEESQWFHYGIPVYQISVEKNVEMDFELANRSVDECSPQVFQGGFVAMFEVLGVE